MSTLPHSARLRTIASDHQLGAVSTCPDCHDRFDLREDCIRCAGQGFVTKPPVAGLR
jgi:DnaJ-class molecular chaperone